MAHELLIALGIIAAVQPAPNPPPMPAPPGGPETRYCLRVDPLPGSKIETIQCETRDEWATLGLDVDEEWAQNGIRVEEPVRG
jgi:hypothetical protein